MHLYNCMQSYTTVYDVIDRAPKIRYIFSFIDSNVVKIFSERFKNGDRVNSAQK